MPDNYLLEVKMVIAVEAKDLDEAEALAYSACECLQEYVQRDDYYNMNIESATSTAKLAPVS